MAVMQVDGHTIGYATDGDGGAPLLLLHGTSMSRTAFDSVRAAMPADVSYRYVMIDFPGSGESPLADAPLTPEELARQAHSLMRELGHDHYHVVGFSLGSIVGAALAGLHPQAVRSVTLIAGWIVTDARMKATFELWRRLITTDRELFMRYVMVDGFTAGFHETIEPMLEAAIAIGAAAVAPGAAGQIDLDITADITQLVSQITAPTLVIGGAEDRWVDVSHSHALGRAIAGSRVEVLLAGHMMVAEQPAQIAALLHAHIAAH